MSNFHLYSGDQQLLEFLGSMIYSQIIILIFLFLFLFLFNLIFASFYLLIFPILRVLLYYYGTNSKFLILSMRIFLAIFVWYFPYLLKYLVPDVVLSVTHIFVQVLTSNCRAYHLRVSTISFRLTKNRTNFAFIP